jgi:hypothetical protein
MNSSEAGTLSGELTDVSCRVPSLSGLFPAFLKFGSTSLGGPSMVACIRRMAVKGRYPMGSAGRHSNFSGSALTNFEGDCIWSIN